MFSFRLVRSNTCLMLVSLVTILQLSGPVSAAVLSHPNLKMTDNISYEKDFKKTEANLRDWDTITQVRHDQQMARWSRSAMGEKSEEWPCPESALIDPCTCTYDTTENNQITIDCSAVQSDSDIIDAFSAIFPFNDIYAFIISNDDQVNPITKFTQNMFQSKSFTAVNVVETGLESIEENVFALSHDTLETLALQKNKLTVFPFDIILEYSKLKYIHLNGNDISELPALASANIHEVNMNHNPRLVLMKAADTFVGTPELRTAKLSGTAVSVVPVGLFSTLEHISQILLSGNNIAFLESGAISAAGSTIEKLDLSDNSLTIVQQGSITGLAPNAELDFTNNNIEMLDETEWKPIFDQVDTGSIILVGNDLKCGCEISWIIADDAQWAKVSDETTCIGGILFSDLDKGFYEANC